MCVGQTSTPSDDVYKRQALPHSAATMAMIRTASGPPAPPAAFAAQPTAASENSTMGGDCKA